MNITLLKFDSIDSTNTEALRQARLGAVEGLCVVARQQTAGRGRHGRTWISEPDAGLYFSIVLRPKIETQFLPLITLMAGVVVYDTLTECGLAPDIKWVNDVLVNEKKISGILAETTETPDGLAVVLGIGINITSSNFPPALAESATSIEAEIGRVFTPDELGETLTRYLGYFYDLLAADKGHSAILLEWQRRSSYFSGKRVRVKLDGGAISGTTNGLEPNGALRLIMPGGDLMVIQTGDVEQLRTDKSEPGAVATG